MPTNFREYYQVLLNATLVYTSNIGISDEEAKEIKPCIFRILEIIKESEKDFNFLHQRRLSNGVSIFKLAGIFLWRLSRSNFLHIKSLELSCETSERTSFTDIHINIALAFVLKDILGIKNLIPLFEKYNDEINELKFQLQHRHTNQEMISLLIQTLVKDENINISYDS